MIDAANTTTSFDAIIGSDEELITLTEAAKHLPKVDGKKVSICTLWRWCRKGMRGVFLEYVRVGREPSTPRNCPEDCVNRSGNYASAPAQQIPSPTPPYVVPHGRGSPRPPQGCREKTRRKARHEERKCGEKTRKRLKKRAESAQAILTASTPEIL